VLTNRTSAHAHACVSETGGAYNSGQDGVTNAFVSGVWWNELIGSLGKHGHRFACRQSIVGGRYALLDLKSGQPAPDFYSTLLWRQLMSPKALRATKRRSNASSSVHANTSMQANQHLPQHIQSGPPPSPATTPSTVERSTPLLRSFAHCARSTDPRLNQRGGVAVLLINAAIDVSVTVDVELPAEDLDSTPRLDYLLTAPDGQPSSRRINLNGRTLLADPNGSLPVLNGVRAHGRSISMPPLSFGFFVWPEANVKACFTERQLIDEKHAESFSLDGAGASKRSAGKAKAKAKSGTQGGRAVGARQQ